MAEKCLVVCSGGLDSTTSAAHARYVDGLDVVLLHFRYGSQAETREVAAVRRIATHLDGEFVLAELDWLHRIGGSSLTRADAPISGPVEGAEYPHEWVPARNLLFLSFAAAYSDAHEIKNIYMGLNLEESAVYPDNTIEFYERVNELLKFATLSRPTIRMPLARMMKWQIVEYAYKIAAPIHLSWSCYRSAQCTAATAVRAT